MLKVYLDATELQLPGISFAGIEDTEIILAGTRISSMDINEKNDEYQRYANDYDIQFIFDDCVPSLSFYTVPLVDIVAKDSDGGFIGSLGQQFDLENDSPICYINKDLECFIISENVTEFLENVESWKNNLTPYHKVTFYTSKEEAKRKLEFLDLHQNYQR